MTAQARGWGPPPAPRSKMVKVVAPISGAEFPGGIHEDLAELFVTLLEATERRGYHCVPGWCWGYAARRIRGSSSWSNHAWGLAGDVNAPNNPMTSTLVTDMPPWMPAMWKDCGFRWGGDYRSRPDAMHYEYMGTPGDVAHHLEHAREYLANAGGAPAESEDDLAEISDEAQRFWEQAYRDLERLRARPTSLGHLIKRHRAERAVLGEDDPDALGRLIGHGARAGNRLQDVLSEVDSSIRGFAEHGVALIRRMREDGGE